MKTDSPANNETAAADAFNRQSALFDDLYSSNKIIQYKRERARQHVLSLLKPGASVLELNSGTGEDACWFAQQGCKVHATDISTGMQEQLRKKVNDAGFDERVSTEICSFTSLGELKNKGPYDLIFSNFAGLNCTGELNKVLASFDELLVKDGVVTMVVMPGFCLWEFLLLFRGRFRSAFRRFFSGKGVKAHIEGQYFKCWYYSPRYITRFLKNEFDLITVEGLCTLVPPSYMENFPAKKPALLQKLVNKENKWKTKWPWRNIGDYYIISLRKK